MMLLVAVPALVALGCSDENDTGAEARDVRSDMTTTTIKASPQASSAREWRTRGTYTDSQGAMVRLLEVPLPSRDNWSCYYPQHFDPRLEAWTPKAPKPPEDAEPPLSAETEALPSCIADRALSSDGLLFLRSVTVSDGDLLIGISNEPISLAQIEIDPRFKLLAVDHMTWFVSAPELSSGLLACERRSTGRVVCATR